MIGSPMAANASAAMSNLAQPSRASGMAPSNTRKWLVLLVWA